MSITNQFCSCITGSHSGRKIKVSFLGDSMIKDATEHYDFIGKIQNYLPGYNYNVTVHADNAVRYINVRQRFDRILRKENPDGFVIMSGEFWFKLGLDVWFELGSNIGRHGGELGFINCVLRW
jgi:hypothetical protein